jgi:hypothetical protein
MEGPLQNLSSTRSDSFSPVAAEISLCRLLSRIPIAGAPDDDVTLASVPPFGR